MSASKCSEEFKQQVVLEVWIAIDTLTHYVVPIDRNCLPPS